MYDVNAFFKKMRLKQYFWIRVAAIGLPCGVNRFAVMA